MFRVSQIKGVRNITIGPTLVEVREVHEGSDSAWLDISASLMLLCLLVGVMDVKCKKIEIKISKMRYEKRKWRI